MIILIPSVRPQPPQSGQLLPRSGFVHRPLADSANPGAIRCFVPVGFGAPSFELYGTRHRRFCVLMRGLSGPALQERSQSIRAERQTEIRRPKNSSSATKTMKDVLRMPGRPPPPIVGMLSLDRLAVDRAFDDFLEDVHEKEQDRQERRLEQGSDRSGAFARPTPGSNIS